MLGFKLPNPKEAKRLWRIAVENHQFFRLNQAETVESSTFGTFGSRKWRMSGRTQAQLKNSSTSAKWAAPIVCLFVGVSVSFPCLAMMRL